MIDYFGRSLLAQFLCWCFLLAWPGGLTAGLHNPLETAEPLDSDLGRFLDRLAELRSLAPPDPRMPQAQLGPSAREQMLEKIQALRTASKNRELTADEAAALGAYLYRVRRTQADLPDLQEALQVLEAARRKHPRHFAIVANLGTVYQAAGALDAAESCLEEAVTLAPPEWERAERYQLLLVKRRLREPKSLGSPPLDPIFFQNAREPLRFVGPSGEYEVGSLAPAEQAKLPQGSVAEATKVVQQLLLWQPEDSRLAWLLGELAAVQGQTRAAARALSQAVDQGRLSTPDLKRHRTLLLEHVAWTEALERLGTRGQQFAWLSRWLAVGAALPLEGSFPADGLVRIAGQARALKPRSGLESLFGEPGPRGPVFHWGMVSWPLAGAGAIFILLLAALQVREWTRRLKRKANRGSHAT